MKPISYVLGAPGSGKSTVLPLLRERLPGHVVLDWDGLMGPAGELAGVRIHDHEHTWPAYGRLIRAVADQIWPTPIVLSTVCTPDELSDWPSGSWQLLDCTDSERRQRLGGRGDGFTSVDEAIADAAHYRSLGLEYIDTTGRTPAEVAETLARQLAGRDKG